MQILEFSILAAEIRGLLVGYYLANNNKMYYNTKINNFSPADDLSSRSFFYEVSRSWKSRKHMPVSEKEERQMDRGIRAWVGDEFLTATCLELRVIYTLKLKNLYFANELFKLNFYYTIMILALRSSKLDHTRLHLEKYLNIFSRIFS